MKNSNYKKILYFIGLVVIITLAIQVYWNYRNYQAGKQQLVNEVQISLDNALEEYYATTARKKTQVFIQDLADSLQPATFMNSRTGDNQGRTRETRTARIKTDKQVKPVELGSPGIENIESITIIKGEEAPGLVESKVGRIILSLRRDTLQLKRLDSLLQQEFRRKGIEVAYGLHYTDPTGIDQKLNQPVLETASFSTTSRSTWLPPRSSLSLSFTTETTTILKQNMAGILLSGLLLAAVIGCLLFLLKVINNQKQLADIKNDFISNLTHEFKTPIATIGVALEGILHFNTDNDLKKTEKYVKTSLSQVEKLNGMVEKLLEVATLSSNRLQLEKEETNIVALAQGQVQKYIQLNSGKKFEFKSNREEITVQADPFLLENVLNNLLDNALKYGGNYVHLNLTALKNTVEILCSDSGISLTRSQAEQVFEKFYRVPKGNTHDVKGYGIGLYYARQIVERHGGTIKAEIKRNTRFIIHLPYE